MLLVTSSARSRVSIMIFRGDSFFPVILAGHSAVHLPHSVQEKAFNKLTQLRSFTSLAPNLEISVGTAGAGSVAVPSIRLTSLVTSGIFRISPLGFRSVYQVLGKARNICRCFE